MRCPKCNSANAHRSHRRGVLEYLAGLLARYPYRCRDCGHRFLALRLPAAQPAPAATPAERQIRTTRSHLARSRRRRELLLYTGAALLFAIFLWYVSRERDSSSSDGN